MKMYVFALALFVGFVQCQQHLTEFPDNFVFGSATAAYQIEGAWDADGKGESIWDRTTHAFPEKISDGQNGDVATDSYNRYKEDVQLLRDAGVNFYRFSISWSRVLPNGDTSDLNEAGLQYYDNLIDELLANGIEPMVTIYHWDLPQKLQELGGLLNPQIIWYVEQYADVLFQRYGDRVKTWITFNEPMLICNDGYALGTKAPLVYAPGVGNYICGHHILLANAAIYDLYKAKQYGVAVGGRIGITINCSFAFPKVAGNVTHEAAADRSLQFYCGQYTHPIFSADGDYPSVMRQVIDARSIREGRAWSRLPVLSEQEKQFIRGKSDFFGLNYYTSHFAEPATEVNYAPDMFNDQEIVTTIDPSWPQAYSRWLYSVPEGLRALLNWIRTEYNNPEVIITENGWSDDGLDLYDVERINYLQSHLQAVLDAINDGCNVTAHTTWSLLDNFEWMVGFTQRFGLHHVDFNAPERTRTAKASVAYLRQVIQTRRVV